MSKTQFIVERNGSFSKSPLSEHFQLSRGLPKDLRKKLSKLHSLRQSRRYGWAAGGRSSPSRILALSGEISIIVDIILMFLS